jgi:hypothetical protein
MPEQVKAAEMCWSGHCCYCFGMLLCQLAVAFSLRWWHCARCGGGVKDLTAAVRSALAGRSLSTPGMGDRLGVEVPWRKRWC